MTSMTTTGLKASLEIESVREDVPATTAMSNTTDLIISGVSMEAVASCYIQLTEHDNTTLTEAEDIAGAKLRGSANNDPTIFPAGIPMEAGKSRIYNASAGLLWCKIYYWKLT